MQRSEFEFQMQRMSGLKKRQDQHLLDAYFEALQSWTVNDLEYAITKVLQEERVFPTVLVLKKKLAKRRTIPESSGLEGPSATISCICRICDAPFSIRRAEALNGIGYFSCGGTGYSTCGRSWRGSELLRLEQEAFERGDHVVLL